MMELAVDTEFAISSLNIELEGKKLDNMSMSDTPKRVSKEHACVCVCMYVYITAHSGSEGLSGNDEASDFSAP